MGEGKLYKERKRDRVECAEIGEQLAVESSDDLIWKTGGAKTKVDNPDRGHGPVIPDVLSGKGGTANMTRGGVPRETYDEDVDAGALYATACPRHRGDAGGRKLPPPTVLHMRYAGPPEGAK